MPDYVSIREYARRKGLSDMAVHKAIKAGHITEASLLIKDGKRKGINPESADKEWSQSISYGKSRKPGVRSRFTNKGSSDKEPITDQHSDNSLGGGAPSTAKAQQVEAFYKAKLRKLEFERKSGEVVDKAQVYRALFAAGQEIRTAFEGIADRFIDDILAAPTRNDAHTILQTAIDEALQSVSELKDRQITRDV